MSEKEKMLKGEFYLADKDETLLEERFCCKTLCQEYNMLKVRDIEARKAQMKRILGKTGQNFHIEPAFWCDYGYNVEIGENFYSNHNLVILDCAKVTFGDNVFLGPNCAFYTALHPLNADKRNMGLECAKPIEVGSNVWCGGNVTVLPGVKIGNDAVIGAGSIVTKDIPEGFLAFGNPCKPVRKIEEN